MSAAETSGSIGGVVPPAPSSPEEGLPVNAAFAVARRLEMAAEFLVLNGRMANSEGATIHVALCKMVTNYVEASLEMLK